MLILRLVLAGIFSFFSRKMDLSAKD